MQGSVRRCANVPTAYDYLRRGRHEAQTSSRTHNDLVCSVLDGGCVPDLEEGFRMTEQWWHQIPGECDASRAEVLLCIALGFGAISQDEFETISESGVRVGES